jgi:hypothetical protein
VHGNRSPVSAWVALIAVAAMLGVGLAGATFIRLEGQGEVLDTWGAPVVTFTLAYSAVVGALAGALAGLLLLVDPSRLVGRWRLRSFGLIAAPRLVGVTLVAAVVVWVHGGEWSADFIGAALLWLVAGFVFDFVLTRHTQLSGEKVGAVEF